MPRTPSFLASCSSSVKTWPPSKMGKGVKILSISPHHVAPNRRYQSTVTAMPSEKEVCCHQPRFWSFVQFVAYRRSLNGLSFVCSTAAANSSSVVLDMSNASRSFRHSSRVEISSFEETLYTCETEPLWRMVSKASTASAAYRYLLVFLPSPWTSSFFPLSSRHMNFGITFSGN